jgi:hypothetical protein
MPIVKSIGFYSSLHITALAEIFLYRYLRGKESAEPMKTMHPMRSTMPPAEWLCAILSAYLQA